MDTECNNQSIHLNFDKINISTHELRAMSHMYNESSLTDANNVSINGDQHAPFADFCET